MMALIIWGGGVAVRAMLRGISPNICHGADDQIYHQSAVACGLRGLGQAGDGGAAWRGAAPRVAAAGVGQPPVLSSVVKQSWT